MPIHRQAVTPVFVVQLAMLLVSARLAAAPPIVANEDRIRPYAANPWYWQYQGQPVLLLGGSDDDNLFQIPQLEQHLDAIAAAGGNYIRNSMSDRRDKGFEIHSFRQLDDGRYDLEQWNPEYWQRFANLLEWTYERGIIVQIEVWDRFDYAQHNWPPNPYHPKNNVNYTAAESGFADEYPEHAGRNRQPFFFTTPKQRNNKVVLKYQQRFVDRILDLALPYPHVLYCIDNETSGDEAWAVYWAEYIERRAKAAGVDLFITEMWDAHDLKSAQHRATFDHPERFAFVDISQNNHQKGETHWDNFQWTRDYLSQRPRPINTVKTYGADGNKFGHTDRDGIERWWRHLIGGAAAVRFHRPDSGLGFTPKAEASIRAARQLASAVPFWELAPVNHLLRDRSANEAFAAAKAGRLCVVYFTDGGSVEVDLRSFPRDVQARWLEIETGRWRDPHALTGSAWTRISPPGPGHWAIAITSQTSVAR
ncbi:MAG: hypothetical protein HY000_36560 [Planctomycetes bacterium]|nr:hypothetical protein [Planctomycetota bacterium]